MVPGALTYGYTNRQQCTNFGFGQLPVADGGTNLYNTEHVLEFQLLAILFDDTNQRLGSRFPDPTPGATSTTDLCHYMKPYWSLLSQAQRPEIGGITMDPLDWVGSVFPGSGNQWASEFILLEAGINTAKGAVSEDLSQTLFVRLMSHHASCQLTLATLNKPLKTIPHLPKHLSRSLQV